jgi:hypothetical protein
VADIHVMPALDIADVSPADFSHTKDLIEWGYRSARRCLGDGQVQEKPPKPLRFEPNPARAA